MTVAFEPGSYRDRSSRVLVEGDRILRALGPEALADWEALEATAFFARAVREGRVVRTERMAGAAAGLPPGDWRAVLRHEAVPFVSYPYEWSFGMLRDAALLHLDLLLEALDEGMTLKDASPYNVQWVGARPVFIDVGSFERLEPGDVWVGYRQFCEMFLYPLLVQALRDVPFQPWLRGRLDGIPAEVASRLLGGLDRLRPAVLLHVWLQARLQARFGGAAVRDAIRSAEFSRAAIAANVRRLARTIRGLTWRRSRSTWSEYDRTHGYTEPDHARKAAFVSEAARARPRRLVWDLGCNTGRFARLAAETGAYVVAMDSDHLAVERLYQALRGEGHPRILPLVVDLIDASPGLGWRGLERKPLAARGRPDLVLCLALIHHVVLGGNVPLAEFVDWLADLGGDVVIEFVTRDDPMVGRLLMNKDDRYRDYDVEPFERALEARFAVEGREVLASGTRILYYGRGRPR
ncbi:MAG TPA: class I SAM-dependent methyltransferase [Thermodesulfobacteriota bacterium]